MGILDRFKLFKFRRAESRNKPPKRQDKPAENVLDLVADQGPKKPVTSPPLKEATGNAFRILQRAHVSEKVTRLSRAGRYVFRVHPKANKPEIKKALERVYDVHVKAVNVINLSGKPRRYGRTAGRTAAWKKAIVTLAPGERIEGLSESA